MAEELAQDLGEMREALAEAREYERRRLEFRVLVTAGVLAFLSFWMIAANAWLANDFTRREVLRLPFFVAVPIVACYATLAYQLFVHYGWRTTWANVLQAGIVGPFTISALAWLLAVATNVLLSAIVENYVGAAHLRPALDGHDPVSAALHLGLIGALAFGFSGLAKDLPFRLASFVPLAASLLLPWAFLFLPAFLSSRDEIDVVAQATSALVLGAVALLHGLRLLTRPPS